MSKAPKVAVILNCLKVILSINLILLSLVFERASLGDTLKIEAFEKEWVVGKNIGERFFDPSEAEELDLKSVTWEAPKSDSFQYGYNKGVAWAKVTIFNNSSEPRDLVFVFNKAATNLSVFSFENEQVKHLGAARYKQPIWEKPLPSRFSPVSIHLEPHSEKTFLVRIYSLPIANQLKVKDLSFFLAEQHAEDFYLSILFGLVLGTIVFNILLYLLLRA